MRFKIKRVPLDQIELEDDSYRITTNDNTDDLVASIQRIGIVNPPLLVQNNSNYTIVCGFRRISASRRLGWKNIDARILDASTQKRECVKYAIVDNTYQRSLNLIELSRSINLIYSFLDDTNHLGMEMAAMGLPENRSLVKKIQKISHLPKTLQNGILSNTLSLSMALDLNRLERETGLGFVELFANLKLSLSKQREILTLIKEIARRDDATMLEVLNDDALEDILNNDRFDRNQKSSKISTYLKQRRFPIITKTKQIFEAHVKGLNLKAGAQLIPSNNFESTEYTLKFTFSSYAELQNHKSTFDAV
ncbi:MAG: ParB N-terminal domain-containing protein, partial [Desulfobacterales bacterium]